MVQAVALPQTGSWTEIGPSGSRPPTRRRRDIKDEGILRRTGHDHPHRLELMSVHLDMHGAGGDPNKVARPCLARYGEFLAGIETCLSRDDVDRALCFAMVVGCRN